MGRAKLNMELIKNDKSRISTYQKRKASLKKKTEELGVLCGVQTCIILAGPPLSGQHPEVDTWPENNPAAIRDLIKTYKKQSPDDHRKRTLTLSNFLDDQKKKAENSLSKLRKGNYELKYPTWDEKYNGLLEEQLRGFGSFLEGKIEVVKARIELLKNDRRMEMFSGQNYGVENENSNNIGAQFPSEQIVPPYLMQSLVRRKSMEFMHPHCISEFNSNDPFSQTEQVLQLDQNPTIMMLTNNNNSAQFNYGASSSNMLYAPLIRQPQVVVNNPILPSRICYYAPAMQPNLPFLQCQMNAGSSSQMHASQVQEYFQGDFEMKKPQ